MGALRTDAARANLRPKEIRMSPDPLANERFRTIVADATDSNPDGLRVRNLVDAFPDAHFEYRRNAAGVRIRRVVVASHWEVDTDQSAGVHPDRRRD